VSIDTPEFRRLLVDWYDSNDVMPFVWYSDEQIQRETSERLYTVEQINGYRWQPMNHSLKMPYSIESNLLLQPLKAFVVQSTLPNTSAVVVALDANHAKAQYNASDPELVVDWCYELDMTRPNIETF